MPTEIIILVVLLLVAGALAAAPVIVARQPNARQLIDKIVPFQGIIGILLGLWCLYQLIQILRYISGVFATLQGVIYFVTVLVGLALGFISAERTGPDTVRINVSDSGPGIDAAHQATIFEKFRQIDGSVTRSHGGTGLGLAISRELTLLLGGTISVHSIPGQGATFSVVLPLKIEARSLDVRGTVALT